MILSSIVAQITGSVGLTATFQTTRSLSNRICAFKAQLNFRKALLPLRTGQLGHDTARLFGISRKMAGIDMLKGRLFTRVKG